MTDPNVTRSDPDVRPPSLADTAETEVSGYTLLGTLGAGACGVVYRARQHALNREVALKTVQVDGGIPAQVLARFEKEAQALARLQHPGIVQVYEFGRRGTQVFLAMELLDGQDLEKRILAAGPTDEPTAWQLARQAAAALAHAAAAGVYHRDVKPANLFLVPPPTGFPLPPGIPMVKVTDFGLALTRDSTEGTDQRLTRPGVTLGTPVYMAPEQFASPDVDHRADIYALGVTVCQMLTGRTPFDGQTVWEVMKLKARPPELPDRATPATRALLLDMLAADPDERIASYDELLGRIDAVLAGEPPPAGKPGKAGATSATDLRGQPGVAVPRPPVFNRRTLILTAAGLGVGGVVGVWAVGFRNRRPPFRAEELYDSQSVLGWNPIGGSWSVEEDADKARVLQGEVPVTRAVLGGRSFRLTVGLDLHAAKSVEVRLGPAAITITKNGAAGVPYPDLTGKAPYVEVRFERAGGKWRAFFAGRPAGEWPDESSKLGPFELTIAPSGGPVRVESARTEPAGA